MIRRELAAAPLLALAVLARADTTVDLQVAGNEKIAGTIRPVASTESFLGVLARGTSVSASVKAKGKGAFVPMLALRQGGVDVPGATVVVKGRGKARLPSVVPGGGEWRVEVSGQGGSGDYDLAIAFRPQKAWNATGDLIDPDVFAEFAFAAPAGARAAITLSRADGGF